MTIVSLTPKASTARDQSCSEYRHSIWIVLLLGLAFTWGCSGVTSGRTAQPAGSSSGSAAQLNISGTVSPTAGGNGAILTLSGAATASATANVSGSYSFSGLRNGTYAVTPSRAGYVFTPATQSVTLNGSSVSGVDFTASSQQTSSISGTISPVTGGAGATVTLSGAAAANTTSDSAGAYIFSGLVSGSYTVTPSNRGFAYSPASQNVTLGASNVTGINFTATPQTAHTVSLTWTPSSTTTVTGYNVYRSTVSGSLFAKVNATPIGGLAYTDSTVQNGVTYYFVTTALDANGSESIFSNQVPAVIP